MARDEIEASYREWLATFDGPWQKLAAAQQDGFEEGYERGYVAGLRRAEPYMSHISGCPQAEHPRTWSKTEMDHWADTNEPPPCECGLSAIASLAADPPRTEKGQADAQS